MKLYYKNHCCLRVRCRGLPGLALAARGQAALTHRYSFNDPAGSQTLPIPSAGPSWDGTLVTNGGSPQLTGTGLVLDGEGDFAQLPPGITTNYTQFTVEFWADSANNPYWTRVFSLRRPKRRRQEELQASISALSAPGNYQNLDYLSTNGVDAYANSNPGIDGTTNEPRHGGGRPGR